MNAQVKTQDGQQLGQIEDLIVNPQTGKIEFAVVSKAEKLIPIPMQLLQCAPQGSSSTSTSGTTSGTSTTESTTPGSTTSPSLSRSGSQAQRVTFTAQVDQEKLQQAPSFSRTQWPDISPTWSQQVYSHFGVQPEAAGGTGSSSSSTSQGKSSSSSPSTSDPSKSSSDTEKKSKDKSEN
jgi:PRC-barrel domain protein